MGTIFSIGTDGSGYRVLHQYNLLTDGSNPSGSLVLSNNTLYGMTSIGGLTKVKDHTGTLFSIQTDGSGFTVLYPFGTDPIGGSEPSYGALTVANNRLWGMASEGGTGGSEFGGGTIFSVAMDGSDRRNFSFPTGGLVGENPNGSLLINGTSVYGTAAAAPLWGVIFGFDLPGQVDITSSVGTLFTPTEATASFATVDSKATLVVKLADLTSKSTPLDQVDISVVGSMTAGQAITLSPDCLGATFSGACATFSVGGTKAAATGSVTLTTVPTAADQPFVLSFDLKMASAGAVAGTASGIVGASTPGN